MKTQHICPFCGNVMHESGGTLTIVGRVVTAVIGIIFAAAFIANILKSRDITAVISGVLSLLVLAYVFYKLYNRSKK